MSAIAMNPNLLRNLKELLDAGLLTDGEFADQKVKLLDAMFASPDPTAPHRDPQGRPSSKKLSRLWPIIKPNLAGCSLASRRLQVRPPRVRVFQGSGHMRIP